MKYIEFNGEKAKQTEFEGYNAIVFQYLIAKEETIAK